MTLNKVDFANPLAQQYRRSKEKIEWLIWLVEHAEEVAEEVLRREHAEFLRRLAPMAVDGDRTRRYRMAGNFGSGRNGNDARHTQVG